MAFHPVIQIDRADFARWLDQLPEDKGFKPGDCDNCPLAIYLQELHPGKEVIIGGNGVAIDVDFYEFDSESWEQRFMRLFDTWQLHPSLLKRGLVDPATARKTLEYVREYVR